MITLHDAGAAEACRRVAHAVRPHPHGLAGAARVAEVT
jgi:hypothetical protein